MSKENKVINLSSYKNKGNNKNMIVIVALFAAVFSVLFWNFFIKDNSEEEAQIPKSNNISYDLASIKPITPIDIINKIERSEIDRIPLLIYLYTTWCSDCKQQLPIMNEIARKFQNTDLEVMFVAIDNDVTREKVISDLQSLPKIHFEPQYLSDKIGLKDMLNTKAIKFSNRIPFIVLIDKNSKITIQSSGSKSLGYINKKVLKSLFKEDEN